MFYCANKALFNVPAGHVGLKYSRFSGVGDKTLNPGYNVVLPWFERPIIYDIRARAWTMQSITGSKDLQMVNISLRVLARPNPKRLPELYRTVGLDKESIEEKILPSIANEVLKSVVAKYNAASLLAERELVSQTIRATLEKRAQDFNIILDDVSLVHIQFSPEYEKAVEQKQVALQQAQRAEYLVRKADQEKQQIIIKAEAEKQSAAMIGDAIKKNPGFIELRRIDVAKDVANVLSKSSNRMVLSADALMLNLTDAASGQSAMSLGTK